MKVLDVVALEQDIPSRGLRRGQVGTIVEQLDERHFEVEFSDIEGRPYALEALPAEVLLQLHHHPRQAA